MADNRFGLDDQYFRLWMQRVIPQLVNMTPSEAARELARMSRAADEKVMHEPEFSAPLIERAEQAEREAARLMESFDALAALVGFSKDRCEQAGDSPFDCAGMLVRERDEWKKQAEAEAEVCSMYRDERDALAAHNQRLISGWFAVDDCEVDSDEMAVATAAMHLVTQESPDAQSLDRLKAQYGAQAIADLIRDFIPWEVDEDVKAFMRQRRDELRAKANEAQS